MKIKILLADDENGWLFASLLEQYNGFEFVFGPDGEPFVTKGNEAVDLARRERPDVILMDLRMPRMSGLEAIRQIRGFDPDVPIIAFSAYTDKRTRSQALAAGATSFFVKPADYRKLYEQICDLVAARPQRGTSHGLDAAHHDSLAAQLAQYQANLDRLLVRQAKYGLDVPTGLQNEIDETLAAINRLREQIFGTAE